MLSWRPFEWTHFWKGKLRLWLNERPSLSSACMSSLNVLLKRPRVASSASWFSFSLAASCLTCASNCRNCSCESTDTSCSPSWASCLPDLSTNSCAVLTSCSRLGLLNKLARCFCKFLSCCMSSSSSSFMQRTAVGCGLAPTFAVLLAAELFIGKKMPVCLYWLGFMLKLAYSMEELPVETI